MNEAPICPYCGETSELKSTAVIYGGRDFGLAYICKNYPTCDAYVGVHRGTTKSKGTLANAELRELRKECHAIFDPIWKRGDMKRGRMYAELAKAMDLKEVHFGSFTVDQCKFFLKISGEIFYEDSRF